MNIILTQFASDSGSKGGTPVQTKNLDKATGAADKAIENTEKDTEKAVRRPEKIVGKPPIDYKRAWSKPKTPPPPMNGNNPPPPMMGAPAMVRPGSPKIGSKNAAFMAFRHGDPRVPLDLITADSSVNTSDMIPVGELRTSKERAYASLPKRPVYNILSDISAANAKTPEQMAALGGVGRAPKMG